MFEQEKIGGVYEAKPEMSSGGHPAARDPCFQAGPLPGFGETTQFRHGCCARVPNATPERRPGHGLRDDAGRSSANLSTDFLARKNPPLPPRAGGFDGARHPLRTTVNRLRAPRAPRDERTIFPRVSVIPSQELRSPFDRRSRAPGREGRAPWSIPDRRVWSRDSLSFRSTRPRTRDRARSLSCILQFSAPVPR